MNDKEQREIKKVMKKYIEQYGPEKFEAALVEGLGLTLVSEERGRRVYQKEGTSLKFTFDFGPTVTQLGFGPGQEESQ